MTEPTASKSSSRVDDCDVYLPLGTPLDSMRARIRTKTPGAECGLAHALGRLARNDGTVDEIADEYRMGADGSHGHDAPGEEPRDALDQAFMGVLDVDLDGVVIALRMARSSSDERRDGL